MKSPFSKDRYEFESSHLYYLPEDMAARLEDFKPTYLIGTRGSGKTTLLKSLYWRERLYNPMLRGHLGNDAFRGNFIGCYVKLPTVHVKSLGTWTSDWADHVSGQVFAFYLELVSTELVVSALADLLAEGILDCPSGGERDSVNAISRAIEPVILWPEGKCPVTLRQLREALRTTRTSFERSSQRRISEDELFQSQFIPSAGELSRSVAHYVQPLIQLKSRRDDQPWHFKICMDEAECLTRSQQRAVNTLVRISETPLSFVLSYVGVPDDMTTTLVPNLTLQKADFSLVVIDDIDASEFERLCDGVATIRIRAELQDSDITMATVDVLGDLQLNDVIHTLVGRSEGSFARALIEQAHQFARSPWARARGGQTLPYIESYLAWKLDLQPPEEATTDALRQQESAEFRKKIVASYLSICRELRVKHIPYCTAPMVFGASDRCIRDYLSQMDHIYKARAADLREFVTTECDLAVQSEAIRSASEEKRASIPASGVLRPVQVGRLVRGLATLTAMLQQGSSGVNHLRSSERGWFTVRGMDNIDLKTDDLAMLLCDAADAGFLRVAKDGAKLTAFRIHTSLAAAFGFSYRGAYYTVPLARKEVEEFIVCVSENETTRHAESVCRRIDGEAPNIRQRLLFANDGWSVVEDDE